MTKKNKNHKKKMNNLTFYIYHLRYLIRQIPRRRGGAAEALLMDIIR